MRLIESKTLALSAAEVANIHEALAFITVREDVIKLLDAPDSPTRDEWRVLLPALHAERAANHFGDATREALTHFQVQNGLGDARGGVVDHDTAKALNSWLERLDLLSRPHLHVITGVVSDVNGLPVAGLRVRAFDQDLRHRQPLGEVAITNTRGGYEIRFGREDFQAADATDGSAPDPIVEVLPPNGDDVLASGQVSGWARQVEVINVVLPQLERQPTEFDRLQVEMPPLLQGQGEKRRNPRDPSRAYADLPPFEVTAADARILSERRETTLAPEAIEAWAQAARMVREALLLLGEGAAADVRPVLETLGWPFLFAWLRGGGAPELSGMLRGQREQWAAAQQFGVTAARVRAMSDDEWTALVSALERCQDVMELDADRAPFDPLARALRLTPGGLPRDLALTALQVYRKHGLDDIGAFRELAHGQPAAVAAQVERFVRTLRLHELTAGNSALVELLNDRIAGQGEPDSTQPLAAWKRADWLAAARKAAGQGPAPDGPPPESVAAELQVAVEQLHPVESLAARLDDGAIAIAGLTSDFLARHAVGVKNLLRGEALDSAEVLAIDDARLSGTLRNLGRYGRIGLDFQAGAALIDAGVPHPGALMSLGPDVMQAMLSDRVPEQRLTGIVAQMATTADAVGGAMANVTATAAHWWPKGFAAVVSGGNTAGVEPPREITGPTVAGIFGDLGECECPAGESVLSPPAYLVDLLGLLAQVRATGAPLRTARDVFFERRPDVRDLELSAHNAETELPHIDIVLELMEWHASADKLHRAGAEAPSGSVPGWFAPVVDARIKGMLEGTCGALAGALTAVQTAVPAQWKVTDGVRSWLLEAPAAGITPPSVRVLGMSIRRTVSGPHGNAEPVNRSSVAYQALKASVFPWQLPWDREAAEVAALLSRLGVSRAEVRRLQPEPASAPADLEALGVNQAQWNLLVDAPRTGDALWQVWGFLDSRVREFRDPASAQVLRGAPVDLLQRASVLCDRTGLSLENLEAALATQFVGGMGLTERTGCEISKMRLRAAAPNPDWSTVFDRLHRFGRLWLALPGWSAALLDTALMSAFGPLPAPGTDWLDQPLRGVAATARVARETGLPPDVILSTATADARERAVADLLGITPARLSLLRRLVADPWPALTTARPINERVRATIGLGSFMRSCRELLDGALAPEQVAALVLPATDLAALGLPPVAGLRTGAEIDAGLNRLAAALRAVATFSQLPEDFKLLWAMLEATVLRVKLLDAASTDLLREAIEAGNGRVADVVRKALTTDLKGPTWTATGALLSEKECDALVSARGTLSPEERCSFLIDRIAERSGDLESRLLELLPRVMDVADAQVVVKALASPGSTAAGQAMRSLSQETPGAAAVPALFSRTEASALVKGDVRLPDTVGTRMRRVLVRTESRLREGVVVNAVQAWASTDEPLARGCLGAHLPVRAAGLPPGPAMSRFLSEAFWRPEVGPLPPTERDALVAWSRRLDRLALLRAALPEIEPLVLHSAFDWSELLLAEPPSAPSSLVDLLWLVQPEHLSVATVVGVVRAARAPQPTIDGVAAPLAARLDCSVEEAKALCVGALGPPVTSGDLLQPTKLRRVFERAQYARRLRATDRQLVALADGDDAACALTARELLAAAVGNASWPVTLRAVGDELRVAQRDALVSWLRQPESLLLQWQQRPAAMADADAIYERLLIDPKVDPCFRTTRITQAIAAVQLFVQRAMFGLEPDVVVSDHLRQRWSWMRSYRLWEANRKVFLFPENWLFPELRDDKSASFRQLEAALGQGELTADLARQAFALYLDDVAQAGQVVVLGLYEDVRRHPTEADRTLRDLYVVGRTANPPYLYYWRRCVDFGHAAMEWTPWQRVEIDVQGDHLVLMVLGGDLHLAWVVFGRKAGDALSGICEATVAWSRFNGRSWSRVESSAEKRDLEIAPGRNEQTGFALRARCDAAASASELSIFTPDTSTQNHRATMPADVIGSDSLPTMSLRTELVVEFEIWLKVRSAEGNVVYVPAPQSSAALVSDDRLTSIGPGGAVILGPLREHGWKGRVHIDRPPVSVAVPFSLPAWSWHAEVTVLGTTLRSARRTTAPLSGWRRVVAFYFVVDTTAMGRSATDLGFSEVDQPRQWMRAAAFAIRPGARSGWSDAPAPTTLDSPAGTAPTARGYRELAIPPVPFAVAHSTFALPVRVFEAARVAAYQAVPASRRGALESDVSTGAVWYFEEADGRCYVDLGLSPGSPLKGKASQQSFTVLADGYQEASLYRLAWTRDGALDDAAQRHTFSIGELPEPGRGRDPETWPHASERDKLTYDSRLPYAVYNWEVFFHAPMLIADQLTKHHKFAEAEQWLRVVFDPTRYSAQHPKAFLRFRAFRDLEPGKTAEAALKALASAAARRPGEPVSPEIETIRTAIERWRALPYRPFVVARRRPMAFLGRTVFAYVEHLLAWGDSLFRRSTREAVAEATQLYVLAARILGPRPRKLRAMSGRTPRSYAELSAKWDEFANAWIEASGLGNASQGNAPPPAGSTTGAPSPVGFLYFCLPQSDKLDLLRNSIDERLFNIRHCRNIDGVAVSLPLTEPQIDVELLTRATAAGLDLTAIVEGLYAPPPAHRYAVLAARATELANEVRSLGAAVLSAIEKRDGERLSQLRSANEQVLLQLTRDVRKLQIEEAQRNVEALRASRRTIEGRFRHLAKQLGKPDMAVPAQGEIGSEEPLLGRFTGGADQRSSWGLIAEESKQLEQLALARTMTDADSVARLVAVAFNTAAAGLQLAAIYKKDLKAWAKASGSLGNAASSTADGFRAIAQIFQTEASQQAMAAGHIRRRDDWAFQWNQTGKELQQLDRQLLANEIRVQIATREAANHEVQIEHSRDVDDYLRSKFSNAELYEWMRAELATLHRSAYDLALRMARQAERAAERELGRSALGVVSTHYWNSQRMGLLAGEHLHHDLKRLDAEYLQTNRREHELTKHVSLRLLDPKALVDLLTEGKCEFWLPEWLFDMDVPGHYVRRLKSVSLSVPCVVGPYASVNCRLTLLRSDIRRSASVARPYAGVDAAARLDDDRFEVRFGATESIVTSSGRDDTGLFDANLRDERYLPFEYAGAVSQWQLTLPQAAPQFDLSTITDVVLHIRYTARDGGRELEDAARASLSSLKLDSPGEESPRPLAFLVSGKADFPAEWAQASAAASDKLRIRFGRDVVPYWLRALGKTPAGAKATAVMQDGKGHITATQKTTRLNVAGGETEVEIELGASRVSGLVDVLVAVDVA